MAENVGEVRDTRGQEVDLRSLSPIAYRLTKASWMLVQEHENERYQITRPWQIFMNFIFLTRVFLIAELFQRALQSGVKTLENHKVSFARKYPKRIITRLLKCPFLRPQNTQKIISQSAQENETENKMISQN